MVKSLSRSAIIGSLLAVAITGDCLHPSVYIKTSPRPLSRSHSEYVSNRLWDDAIVPFSDAVRSPRWDWGGYLPSRGIAAAANIRPTTVIANYEFEHNQSGPELTNLRIALESFNYLVIPAGSEVSFNSLTGPRLLSRGYKPGLMVHKGKVVTGVGGGVCVASTGLYNAALLAGFPILERWMHSGPTSYASATRDAAVVYGHKDFRFKNNTSLPVVVRTVVDDTTVRVSLMRQERLPYKVALKEEGLAYIPPSLKVQTVAQSEMPEDLTIQEGAPGCSRKLVRQFWNGNKLLKSELIARDIREPRPRIIASLGKSPQTQLEPPETLETPVLPEQQQSPNLLPLQEGKKLKKLPLQDQIQRID